MYGSREKGYFDLGYKIENLDPIYGSQMLSYGEYEGKLLDDLESAKSEVSLFMDYFQENRVKWLLRKINCPYSVILSGGSPLEDVPNIVRLGKPLPNMVIIDMRIIYYGGLNPFMFGQKDGTILHIVDPSMAAEFKRELLS